VRLLRKDYGWVPYVWLIYLAGIPLNVWLSKAAAWVWAVSLLGIAVFLPLYFLAYRLERRGRIWVIAGVTLLGVLTAPVNPGASVYFIYAGAFVGLMGDTRFTLRAVAVLILVLAGESLLLRLTPYFWVPAAIFGPLIGAINTSWTQRQQAQRRLIQAQEEVERMAKVAERERIARDLHDLLGHTLSVVVLKSELASKLAETDPPRAVAEIRDVERIARQALAEVRSAVRGYSTRSFRTEVAQAETALQAAGVKVTCSVMETGIPPSHEGVLALILREAVTNVIRHARATSCELSLRLADGLCRLEIRDNGCGHSGPEGAGLAGIRSRVEALGGRFQRETGSGTALIVTLPVPSS
jgi:two-component system sensor histidine kinase DesK